MGLARGSMIWLVVVAGCARSAPGPAWPASAGRVAVGDWTEDGGESLEPHATEPAVALEDDAGIGGDDSVDFERIAEEDAAPAPSAGSDDTPATSVVPPAEVEVKIEDIEVAPPADP